MEGSSGVCGTSGRVVEGSSGVCGTSGRVVEGSSGVCGTSGRVVEGSSGVWDERTGCGGVIRGVGRADGLWRGGGPRTRAPADRVMRTRSDTVANHRADLKQRH